MRRREFLAGLAVSPWALAHAVGAQTATPRLLVLIELNGGNDGLNTVVPYRDPQYQKLRPQLGIARDQVLQLDERVGLNPVMQPLMASFARGELAVVQGVGYPGFNRSHFRAIDIWDTASGAARSSRHGWLTRIGDSTRLGDGFAADAVVIGRNPGPVSGGGLQPIVIDSLRGFADKAAALDATDVARPTDALRHILAVQNEIHTARQAMAARRPKPPGSFPKNALGRDLAEAARLLIGTPVTPIVKLAQSSYDTHVNQRKTHDGLLQRLAEGLAALRDSLYQAGIWDRTLVLTYSEFGRRARENANKGTDHGTAAPMFVLGGAVRGGLYGPSPDLSRLDNDDLALAIDYRCVYNAVLGDWFGLPDVQIEPARYPALPML